MFDIPAQAAAASGSERSTAPCSQAESDLQKLYAHFGPSIRTHCTRLLGDATAAEDAAHEVFLRVRRFSGNLPDAAGLRPWLLRIATNICLNELRSRRVRACAPPQLAVTATSNLEDVMAARNDARRFLQRLSPRARAVAWLTYVDGMLQHEVAATLGVSRRTVVNYLNEVRARGQDTTHRELAMAL